MSYEEVEDVEKALQWTPDDTVMDVARRRYPVVDSDIEALFLGRLDDTIDHFRLEIRLPRVHVGKLAQSSDTRTRWADVVNSIKLPTCALVVTVSTAILSILSHHPLGKVLLPYFSCIVTFLSSIPSIRKRLLTKSSWLLAQFDSVQTQVETAMDEIASRGFQILHTTESTMNQALAPINVKLAAITRVESMLKTIKPDIDIPDPSDVKRSFEGLKEKLQNGFSNARELIHVRRSLPSPFQSPENFEWYIVIPYLVAMLAVQLVLAYMSQKKADPLEETNMNPAEVDKEWYLLWTAVQTYITAVGQILLAFLLTQLHSLVFFLNQEIGVFEGNINQELRRTVGGVFEDIFRRGFQLVKAKFLDLLEKVNQLEAPIEKLKAKFPDVLENPEFSELASLVKDNLAGKVQKKRENILTHLSKIFGD
ncbi:hypothetical protein FisN_25Hh166 [Fistulifera solaris]|uniref:Uncharacterized protein n=1 Tax=Fistulifera solaris TaxID=1519565 RepID=A0A1Z5JWG5_FISSO|nr:hypothetical protein FisN_25Hh166 [Fistulifera solaris]|eukprot:GAX18182.1 hypothetical protein FisN_25Hh166 [Fistulifera solaris]